MRKTVIAAATAVLLMAGALPAGAADIPAHIAAAVSDPGRPEADVQRDALRKPAEMLAFAGVKPGDKVADVVPGAGYFTRIFSKAVGPNGKVYMLVPTELSTRFPRVMERADGLKAAYPNAVIVNQSISAFSPPEKLDLIWSAQEYHDFYLSFFGPADIARVNKSAFDALKPGGLYIVLDHSAQAGSGMRDVETLHRADQAQVRREVEAAGFVFVEESDVLRDPADARTINVFDAAIRGKTDQFIMKFRKPR